MHMLIIKLSFNINESNSGTFAAKTNNVINSNWCYEAKSKAVKNLIFVMYEFKVTQTITHKFVINNFNKWVTSQGKVFAG